MEIEEVKSVLKNGKVIISTGENVESLIQGGFGTQIEDKPDIVLSPWEALYLLSNKRIEVSDSENENALDFQALFHKYQSENEEIWTKYLVYRDLRRRGYVVREGTVWGTAFRVYGRGTYGEKAAKYLILITYEGNAIPIDEVREVMRLVKGVKKELIIAVMDRRGEIVYYQLSTLNL